MDFPAALAPRYVAPVAIPTLSFTIVSSEIDWKKRILLEKINVNVDVIPAVRDHP